jgi:hypothetical protein
MVSGWSRRYHRNMNDFRIEGLPPQRFEHLLGLSEAGWRKAACDATSSMILGFPDGVEMRDAAPGESVLLLNFVHHDVANPFRASHAIIHEGARQHYLRVNEIPGALRIRLLSLRAFDYERNDDRRGCRRESRALIARHSVR